MSEEKKDDLDFLTGHEALLNSIHKSKDGEEAVPAETAEEEPIEEVAEETATAEEAAAPVVEEAAETELEEVYEAEPEVEEIVEPEPEAEEIAEPEPVIEEAPEPAPVAAAPAAAQTAAPAPASTPKAAPNKIGGKKKKKKHLHTQRTQTEEERHQELLKHQALEQQEVKEILNLFQKYGKPVVTAILAICVVFIGLRVMQASQLKKDAQADAALSQARSAEDLEAVLDNYSSTPSAPLALMGLAMEKFNSGNVEEAEVLYTEFLAKNPDHEMASQARLNLITCKEAKGQLSDAHLLYGDFVKENPESHLAPVAMLGKARCLEALDQNAEAQIAYEDIIMNYLGSGWAQVAEAKLALLKTKQ